MVKKYTNVVTTSQIIAIVICFALSSCRTYYDKTLTFNKKYEQGEYSEARDYLRSQKKLKKSLITNLIFKSEEHYQKCCDYYNTHYKGKEAIFIPNYKTDIFDGVRYLTQKELERCQTVPEGYTKCLTRNQAADVLGDGWTIDVIVHIFKNMKF